MTFAALAAITASWAAVTTTPTVVSPVVSPDVLPIDGLLGEQQHEAGRVTVAASWIAGSSAAHVTLDTHLIDLDGFDLTKLARMRLDGGAWVAASLWDAPEGGHHRSGTLAFGTLDARAIRSARLIELEIRDVAAPSHLLRWERAR